MSAALLLEKDESEGEGNDAAAPAGGVFCSEEDDSSSCFTALRNCGPLLEEEAAKPAKAVLLFLIVMELSS
jgi:hypothetical protein